MMNRCSQNQNSVYKTHMFTDYYKYVDMFGIEKRTRTKFAGQNRSFVFQFSKFSKWMYYWFHKKVGHMGATIFIANTNLH